MTKSPFLILTFLLAFASAASAQQVLLDYDSTLISVSQESIPPNDSGGRWVETNILLTSHSGLPVRVYNFGELYFSGGHREAFRFDDSAFFRADSIFPNWDWAGAIGYDKPWERKDSLSSWSGGDWTLSFLLPPYGTVRVPFWTQLIGGSLQPDTESSALALEPYSDSIVGPIIYRRLWNKGFWAEDLAPCSAPYIIHFDSLPLNNSGNPVVVGTNEPWYYVRDVSQAHDTILEQTMATYQIVGEYSDDFDPPIKDDNYSGDPTFTFNGAPKSVVHDTLISTLTDCWGTVVTRTPIEAYSVVEMRNCYTLRESGPYTVPFLGGVVDTILVSNTSTFPIELSNLQLSNYKNENNFQVSSAPSVIAAHDSGRIIVNFLDNDQAHDADYPTYSATITGILSPYQQDVSFRDSSFSMDLSGAVDVYCPFSYDYFYTIPLIKRGIHPAGIVFYSNNITTKFSTGKSFLTIYGNNDSVSDYFYQPYYDDPHFTITIGDFDGFGSATLPALMPPDTQLELPSLNTIETLTEFTGDDNHNYRTQLHWPRANDTVTMDVLALGANAPPYDGVAMKTFSSGFSMWPNPASSILHVSSAEPGATIAIYDLLGRELRVMELLPNASLDVSTFPPGIYSVILNAKDGATAVEKLTIVR